MRRVKVLSVHQGWAWGLIWGRKRVENRSRNMRYRGRLYIHASKSRASLAEARAALPELPPDEDLTFGAIIGHVEVTGCVPLADALGMPFSEGPWCILTSDPTPIAPLACRGMQGLFEVDLDELRPAVDRARPGSLFD